MSGTSASEHQNTLILDNREHELHTKITVPHDFVPLHVGDIHICARVEGAVKPVLVLERKSFADFQSSVMDGRYREQRGRLLAFGAEQGARVGYILEGSATALRPPMTASSIDKLVARLMYVHGIPVFRTTSVVDTARLVETLLGQVLEDGAAAFQNATQAQRATDGIHVVKRGNTEDPRHYAISLLCLAHGVSTRIAEAWYDAFGSVAAVIGASADQLAAVKVGARRVGPAIAARCINIWTACGLIK
jgi:ERCC4-type nuclease